MVDNNYSGSKRVNVKKLNLKSWNILKLNKNGFCAFKIISKFKTVGKIL